MSKNHWFIRAQTSPFNYLTIFLVVFISVSIVCEIIATLG